MSNTKDFFPCFVPVAPYTYYRNTIICVVWACECVSRFCIDERFAAVKQARIQLPVSSPPPATNCTPRLRPALQGGCLSFCLDIRLVLDRSNFTRDGVLGASESAGYVETHAISTLGSSRCGTWVVHYYYHCCLVFWGTVGIRNHYSHAGYAMPCSGAHFPRDEDALKLCHQKSIARF